MAGVNKVIILGNVGKDPEIRYTPDGLAIAKFSIATSESWKDKNTGEKVESTEWHRIVLYGKLAEICGEYVKKGSKIYVEGKIKTNKWKDKETGQDRSAIEIVVSHMQMLSSSSSSKTTRQEEEGNIDLDDLDVPF